MTLRFFVSAEDADTKDLKKFFENLDLIKQHQNLILTTPEYYNIHIKGAGVFPLYISSLRLYIGDLLQLWDTSEWKQDDKYFFSITGSPLSGGNSSRYWSKKDGISYKSTTTFSKQIRSAFSLVNNGTTDYGTCVAVDVPKREKSSLTVNDLLEKLKEI